MARLNPTLITTYTAGGAIGAYKAVKFSADNTVVVAAAVTDFVIGVTGALATESGAQCDVIRAGIAEIEMGATVTRGQLVCADANGDAIDCAFGAGVEYRTIGIAEEAYADGDIGAVLLQFGSAGLSA